MINIFSLKCLVDGIFVKTNGIFIATYPGKSRLFPRAVLALKPDGTLAGHLDTQMAFGATKC